MTAWSSKIIFDENVGFSISLAVAVAEYIGGYRLGSAKSACFRLDVQKCHEFDIVIDSRIERVGQYGVATVVFATNGWTKEVFKLEKTVGKYEDGAKNDFEWADFDG